LCPLIGAATAHFFASDHPILDLYRDMYAGAVGLALVAASNMNLKIVDPGVFRKPRGLNFSIKLSFPQSRRPAGIIHLSCYHSSNFGRLRSHRGLRPNTSTRAVEPPHRHGWRWLLTMI